jgi:hypothetical protein
VNSIADPRPDGHCGYRAIAIALGRSEDKWLTVREELIAELRSKTEFYNLHFKARKRGDGDVDDHITAIQTRREEVLDTPALWLDSAQMLYIIATTYRRLFCVYSEDVSFSAFPLDCQVNDNPPIFLCYDPHGLHFLSLSMTTTPAVIPIPKPWTEWHHLSLPEAKDWIHKYDPHFTLFQDRIIPTLRALKPMLYPLFPQVVQVSDSE